MLVKYLHNTSATLPGFDTTCLYVMALLSLTCCTLSIDSLNRLIKLGLIHFKYYMMGNDVNGFLSLSEFIFPMNTMTPACLAARECQANLEFCLYVLPDAPQAWYPGKSEHFGIALPVLGERKMIAESIVTQCSLKKENFKPVLPNFCNACAINIPP